MLKLGKGSKLMPAQPAAAATTDTLRKHRLRTESVVITPPRAHRFNLH